MARYYALCVVSCLHFLCFMISYALLYLMCSFIYSEAACLIFMWYAFCLISGMVSNLLIYLRREKTEDNDSIRIYILTEWERENREQRREREGKKHKREERVKVRGKCVYFHGEIFIFQAGNYFSILLYKVDVPWSLSSRSNDPKWMMVPRQALSRP